MANNIIYKTVLLSGAKGDDGDTPLNDETIPLDGVIYFDGEEIPEGYEETTPPAPTPPVHNYLYKWDFTKSLDDEIEGVTSVFKGQNASGMVRDAQGVHINNSYQSIYLTSLNMGGKTIEIDIAEFNYQSASGENTSVLYFSSELDNDVEGEEPFYYKPGYGWCGYDYSGNRRVYTNKSRGIISGKTIKLKFDNLDMVEVYFNDELIKSISYERGTTPIYIYLGGVNKKKGSYYNGRSHNMTISGVRIYENEE